MLDSLDLSFYLSQFSPFTVLDILLVALVIYGVLVLVRGTRAVQLIRGLIVLALLLTLIDQQLGQLTAFRWMVSRLLPALFLAIPVIFQPELRRALAQLGGQTGLFTRFLRRQETEKWISVVADACRRLSTRRHGALIVIERDTGLQEYIDTGVKLDARISTPLLLNVFHKDVDLHDGGVIIRNGRIAAASCVMPLSNSRMSDRQMGLRHRAALGTSEQTDAVVVVVSEETGQLAIAHNGRILPKQPQNQLESVLKAFLENSSSSD